MSGLEALGVACNIFQTISFARETVMLCRAIYQGQKTPDSRLGENAGAMIEASKRASTSCSQLKTPEAQRLASIANECTTIAQKLESKVQKITKLHKPGNIWAALRAPIKSILVRSEIEDLDKALQRCTATMQTLLTQDICDQSKASALKQDQGFHKIDQDLQSFIVQIAAGYTTMKDLLSIEARLTRAHITKEATQTSEFIKVDLFNTMQQHKTNKATQSQRERLVQSLKFPEMNQRRNGITPPHDDTFNRIFQHYGSKESRTDEASFRGYTHSTSLVWKRFRIWLQSPDSLFWIQGKPGSGKSTLVKHIISHKTTKEFLSQSHSSVKILSHFFWQIGSPSQSNIAGFYSTLVHQLLHDNESLTDEMIQEYPFVTTKDCFYDWSIPDLEQLVLAAFKIEAERTWLCVFIDGLDEYTSDNEEDLVEKVLRLSHHGKVKLCVSSRPEPRLKEQLDHVPNLKLHDLTWADMEAYTQQELKVFEANGSLSTQLSFQLTRELLWKAQGVFLWLRLAMKSVKSGIRNHDEDDLLLNRLRQLPNELVNLYEDMWKRLNQDIPIYRQSAANYFQLALAGISGALPAEDTVHNKMGAMTSWTAPTLLEIGSATEQDI